MCFMHARVNVKIVREVLDTRAQQCLGGSYSEPGCERTRLRSLSKGTATH
jgi:hypothetical protein